MEDVEEEIPMTAQYLKQESENRTSKKIYVEVMPEDDDDQHLVAMWDIDQRILKW